jgi:hypothetical protein
MSQRDAYAELQEIRRKQNKGKQQIAEQKTKGTDPIQSYARDMPNAPVKQRKYALGKIRDGIRPPACPALVEEAFDILYDAEGYMVRYLGKPDVFWDPHYEGEYDVLYGQKDETKGLDDIDTGE